MLVRHYVSVGVCLISVFSHFGPGAEQCPVTTVTLKLLVQFPEMLVTKGDVTRLGEILRDVNRLKTVKLPAPDLLQQELSALKNKLPDPLPVKYCGDVNIEFRLGAVKFDILHRLQRDSRLPLELNAIGNIRVVAETLEYLSSYK